MRQALVTGSLDGFVEVWDYDTCRLRKDLAYQVSGRFGGCMREGPRSAEMGGASRLKLGPGRRR